MAPYTPRRRQKNQIEILGISALVLVGALLSYLAGWIQLGGLSGTAGLVLSVGSVLWWLFGSKTAGDTTNTWVERGAYLEDGPEAPLTQYLGGARKRPIEHYDEDYEAD